jgi:hypothetical protein
VDGGADVYAFSGRAEKPLQSAVRKSQEIAAIVEMLRARGASTP